MNIAINLLPFKKCAGGMITYIYNILDNFGKIAPQNKFFIFTREKILEDFRFNYPNFKYLPIPINMRSIFQRIIFEQTFFSQHLKKHKIDILFNPSPSGPQFWSGKQVTAIHDCAYDRFAEEATSRFHRIYCKLIFPSVVRKSNMIVTVSNFSKEEIIYFYHPVPKKIRVIYEGVPKIPEVEQWYIKQTEKELNIVKPYFLFVGNCQPRKNVVGLIKAFHLLLKNNRCENYYLVITGHRDPKRVECYLRSELKELGAKIIFINATSRKKIAALYREATSLVFPSFYEGFGLPVLEAQSLGVPVLTSNISSLPEVAGKAALYVDPYNIEDIAMGMERIVQDNELRKRLITDGYKNIQRFSWEKTIKELLGLFEEVYYENPPN